MLLCVCLSDANTCYVKLLAADTDDVQAIIGAESHELQQLLAEEDEQVSSEYNSNKL